MWGRLDSYSLPVNIQAKSTGLVRIHTDSGFSFINVAYAQKEGNAQILCLLKEGNL